MRTGFRHLSGAKKNQLSRRGTQMRAQSLPLYPAGALSAL